MASPQIAPEVQGCTTVLPSAHEDSATRICRSPSWLGLVLPMLLGSVLLAAAVMKGHQLLVSGSASAFRLTSRPVQVMLVVFELALGLWLVSGLYRKQAQFVARVAFALLAAASGYLLIEGADCCSCFGKMAVHPGVAFGFDLFALFCLMLLPVPGRGRDDIQHHPWVASSVVSILVFLSVYLVVALPPLRLFSPEAGAPLSSDEIVVLDTERWEGKTLPILDYLETQGAIGQGTWVLVLYHENCPKCENAIRRVLEKKQDESVALVEIPPLSGSSSQGRATTTDSPGVVRTVLDRGVRWSVATPVVLRLQDGMITSVSTFP